MMRQTHPCDSKTIDFGALGWLSLAALVALGGLTGCDVGFEGQSGKLEFFYATDDFSPKKPVAVDSTVRLNTYLADNVTANSGNNNSDNDNSGNNGSTTTDSNEVTVTGVTSNAPSIITVDQFGTNAKHSFMLSAKSAGSADIEVTAQKEDGTTVTDGFTLEAEDAKTLVMDHPCDSDQNAPSKPVYLTDQEVSVSKTLKGQNDRTLTGYGLNPAKLQAPSGSDAKLLTANDSDLLMLRTGSKTGTLTISPTIEGQPLDLELKSEADIDEVGWRLESEGEPTVVPIKNDQGDREGFLVPEFRIAGARVCDAHVDLQVTNNSSSVCEVNSRHIDSGESLLTAFGRTYVVVLPKKKGTCKFEVTPAMASGDVSLSAEVDTADIMK